MTTAQQDQPIRRHATWRVAAAEPRGEWRVTAALSTERLTRPDELAWQLSLTVRAQLGAATIETTATEEPPTWSGPADGLADGWRAQAPVARRTPPEPLVPSDQPPPPPPPPPSPPILPGVVTDGWRPPLPPLPPLPAVRWPTPEPVPAAPSRETGAMTGPDGADEAGDDDEPAEAPAPKAVAPMPFPAPDTEHGDRTLFLALARQRLAGGIPLNMVHPPPVREPDQGGVRPAAPEPVYMNLDRDDVLGTFARAVEEAGGVCHQVVGDVPDILLDQLVAELDAWDVVVSQDPEAVELGERLADRGVEVSPAGRDATTGAALGVTSAVAAIAATGSVVIDSARSGGRLSSVLPPAHLCVLPVERLVATPADVLRGLGDATNPLPSSLVLVTGPSRTGDIEQLLTIGAHGPTALHVVVISPSPTELAEPAD